MALGFSFRWSRFAIAALLAVGVVGAFVAALALRSDALRRRLWREEVSWASAEELPALMDQIAQRPSAGTPLLVAWLDDQRPAVAHEAGQALHALLRRWRDLPVDASSPRVAELAALLAQAAPTWRAPARRAAAQLAAELIEWPLDERSVDVAAVLADCETILRAADSAPDELLAVAPGPPDGHVSPPWSALPISRRAIPKQIEPPWALVDPLPGGGLPVEPVPFDDAPPGAGDSSEAVTGDGETSPPTPAGDPPRRVDFPFAVPLDVVEREARSSPSPEVEPRARSNEPANIGAPRAEVFQSLDDVALMRRLHDAAQRQDAAEELRRRGFDALHLEVARRLTDQDPQVRQELANALPQIPGVDARPWLEELAADADPDVRRTAIAVLGSTAGQTTDAWLRELLGRETDPRVAAQIQAILETRK